VQLLDKSVGAGSDFFQKDYKMLHDTVRPFRTKTVQLPEITGRTEKTFQLWGLSGKPLPGSAPRIFFCAPDGITANGFLEEKTAFSERCDRTEFFKTRNYTI
jgi:hypothetical protein